MIRIGGWTFDTADPATQAALAGAVVLGLVLLLGLLGFLAARRSARGAEALAAGLGAMNDQVRRLSDGQERLTGNLHGLAEAQAAAQTQTLALVERRLEEVQRAMGDSLAGTATRTARSLGELQERLAAIDRAQANIEKLSGDVLGLQDILSNKQTRGAFGEIQLREIVARALPPDAYAFQATLSNGKRADCLIRLPDPPGPLVIDAKFPLEPYEAIRAATTPAEATEAARAMRAALRAHIRAIAEKYIVEGETADGALMFVPSEAVYAECHAHFAEQVREGFAARVWIVSPTTCMATLNTLRAVLKDAQMKAQAGAIRRELGLLHKDVMRLVDRVGNLDRHFGQAQQDIEAIKVSAQKAGARAGRLDSFEFEDGPAELAAVRGGGKGTG